MPVSFGGFGGSTNSPFGPLNVWTTPTEGFPGSPTTAIGIVTTPRFDTGSTDSDSSDVDSDSLEDADALELVVDDELPHAVTPTESAASTPTNASRCHRMKHPLCSLLTAVPRRLARVAFTSFVARASMQDRPFRPAALLPAPATQGPPAPAVS